ncbi:hypothetical protein ACTI_75760 [Actinoplanes sp. OR16]|nr:hypothetical protein ACTI_75760 [Actinoplanes sp. OR16]
MILHAVLPGNIDDPAAPSGGNRYDREVLRRLSSLPQMPSAQSRPAQPSPGQSAPGQPSPGQPSPAQAASAPTDSSRASAPRGMAVREIAVAGDWPRPDQGPRNAVAAALESIPGGETVLLDGLVACAIPDVLEPHATRLRLVILVHLPLADETSLSEQEAAELELLERRALHLASTVIATSTQAARRVEQLHGLSGVHAVPPGVDPAPSAVPSPEGARFLTVASLTHRKGQDVLVAALKQMSPLLRPADPAHPAKDPDQAAPPQTAGPARPTARPQVASASHEAASPQATSASQETASPQATSASQETASPQATSASQETASPQATSASQETASPQATSASHEAASPQAASASPEGAPPWTCTLVGAGPAVPEVIPGVRLAGPLTGPALDAAYANADLFILPSRAETYGMVVTEALARGLPVVATDVGGVPEALGTTPQGPPGRLLPPGDPEALARTLHEWLTDPALRDRWRAAARIRREHLTSWDETARQIAAILDPARRTLRRPA